MRSISLILPAVFLSLSTVLLAQQAEQPAQPKYIGADKCKMCHPDQHKSWAKTAHARAFDLLKIVAQEKNEQCLTCHVTGSGRGGFSDEGSTPGLAGVTCEACHGPGGDHNGDKTKIVRVPPATVCAACHQEMNIHAIH